MNDMEKAALERRIDELCQENDKFIVKLNAEHIVRQNVEVENAKLRDEIKQLKFRDATLTMMVKLMHLAISYMQGCTDKVAVYDGIRLSAGYFERRMAALGILGIEVD